MSYSGVEFEENEKTGYQAEPPFSPATGAPASPEDKYPVMVRWLMKWGVQSPKAAFAILIGVVIINVIIMIISLVYTL